MLYHMADVLHPTPYPHLTCSVVSPWQVCTDCPDSLIPFHVKGVPEPVCDTVTSLQSGAEMGQVWDSTLCPEWCMSMDPVDQMLTESGPVDVRICQVKHGKP